jgi:hypothetical protein
MNLSENLCLNKKLFYGIQCNKIQCNKIQYKLRPFVKENIDKLDLSILSTSSNPLAIQILENNITKIDWDELSKNPYAIQILEKNLDKVDWDELSGNPNAIHILEKNLTNVNWDGLSFNPNAIHILEKNITKINWCNLSENHSIFQLDYDAMRENNKGMSEEIAKIVWHPSRMAKWPEDPLIDDSASDSENLYIFSKVRDEENITCTIREIKICIKIRS